MKILVNYISFSLNQILGPSLYYFIALIKHREQVLHTQLITSKDGLKKGYVEFPNYIQLHHLPPDFICSVEVFCLVRIYFFLHFLRKLILKLLPAQIKSRRPLHGKKCSRRRINKVRPTYYWILINILGHTFTPSRIQNVPIDSGFQKAGYALINRAHVLDRVRTFRLADAVHPVEGTIRMSLKCCAETFGTVAHRGFLSLYQTIDNMGSWTRFWCTLFEGCMRFWRYPEDEENKVFFH